MLKGRLGRSSPVRKMNKEATYSMGEKHEIDHFMIFHQN